VIMICSEKMRKFFVLWFESNFTGLMACGSKANKIVDLGQGGGKLRIEDLGSVHDSTCLEIE
jgi:hypothetical protein